MIGVEPVMTRWYKDPSFRTGLIICLVLSHLGFRMLDRRKGEIDENVSQGTLV
jgi:hypothetical protein